MGVTRVIFFHTAKHSPSSLFFIQENMKNMKTCDYRPLLLPNRLPEMYLNNPKSDTQRFGGRTWSQAKVTFNPNLIVT